VEHERSLFLSLAAVLIGFGVLIVHSASITSRPTEFEQIYLTRHLAYLAIALAAAVVAGSLPPRAWVHIAPLLYWGTILLLVMVLVPGLGTKVKGAQRWLRLGSMSMQPSELAKLALPLYVGLIISRKRKIPLSWLAGLIAPVWPILLMVGLVFVEPDLGTSVFLAAGGALVLLSGGWPIRNFLLVASTAVPAVVFLVIHKPYQMQRITGFFATWADWTNAPYQLKQSLVTLGAGGVWGVGLGRGFQKLSFLPEANTDFVFAVVGEELGLVGMLTILVLWLGLYWMGVRLISRLPREGFEHHAAYALLTQLVLQAGVNVAVVTAMVPPKGIAHPLLSYGGSNLVVSIVALGMIVSLTRLPEPISAEK